MLKMQKWGCGMLLIQMTGGRDEISYLSDMRTENLLRLNNWLREQTAWTKDGI